LFANILPFLKSSSDVLRDTVALALERTNPVVYEVFFDAMKSIEQEFSRKGKAFARRKEKDRLRLVVTCIL
jgi:hypothetical protein